MPGAYYKPGPLDAPDDSYEPLSEEDIKAIQDELYAHDAAERQRLRDEVACLQERVDHLQTRLSEAQGYITGLKDVLRRLREES